jgi:hypothetical protein
MNSNLLCKFYKTPFCRMRSLERGGYKANKCDKMAYKTSVIQYFFLSCPYFKLKKSSKHDAREIIFVKYKGLVTLVTRRTIASFEFKLSKEFLFETHLSVIMTVLKVQNRNFYFFLKY